MKPTSIGTRKIDPATDDFFRAIIEERKTLAKKHPHYLLLKIIANSLYGIFAELNKYEYGKNKTKHLDVFSGDRQSDEKTRVVERPGRWHSRWIVEAWDRLLFNHFRRINDPESALVARELWFGELPAVMRIRITTANVMAALRKRDPGAAKPYNFALAPILRDSVPNCTLIAPFSKHPEEWLTQEYTEIHTGEILKLFGEHSGKKLLPQTLSAVVWKHYLHPEDKSLSPDGKRCGPYTNGLLRRRPIQAMTPFELIGKEVERSAQEGEDISTISGAQGRRREAPRSVRSITYRGEQKEHFAVP